MCYFIYIFKVLELFKKKSRQEQEFDSIYLIITVSYIWLFHKANLFDSMPVIGTVNMVKVGSFHHVNWKILFAVLILIFLMFLCSNLHLHMLIIYSIINFKMEQTAILWPIGTHFNLFNLTVHHLQGIQAIHAQFNSIQKLACIKCLNILCG